MKKNLKTQVLKKKISKLRIYYSHEKITPGLEVWLKQ
jgi:hypothetical protein